MKRFLVLVMVALLSFFITKAWYTRKERKADIREETQVMVQSIENMSKLVVTEANLTEIYNYKNAKKYFYDTFEFNKSVIVLVNAKVQVSFDLEKMDVQIDSLNRRIIIRSVPEEEITIIPDVKYYDMQQSTFNTFSPEELNRINKKSIEKIRKTAEVMDLRKNAKKRLMIELSKIYQLSRILGWEVVDETGLIPIDNFVQQKPKF